MMRKKGKLLINKDERRKLQLRIEMLQNELKKEVSDSYMHQLLINKLLVLMAVLKHSLNDGF